MDAIALARERAIDHVIGIEGGYSDHPADSGGRTRWGITEATARRHGYQGDMRGLPRELAVEIYEGEYWAPLRCGEIAALGLPRTAGELFESGVNVGIRPPARWIQRAMNALNRAGALYADVAEDGVVGAQTLQAALALAEADGAPEADRLLTTILNVRQGAYYLDLCARRVKDEAFIRGWLRHRVVLRTAAEDGP